MPKEYRSTKECALIFAELIIAARHRGTVTYQELAELIGLPGVYGYRHQIGKVLDAARAVDNFADKQEIRPERMDVVLRSTGQPGSGKYRLPEIRYKDD